MANRNVRRKKALDMSESVPVKKHYVRRFFYAFSVCFILLGLIGILWFVYTQDPNAFGTSEKYLDRANEAMAQSDLKTALEYYEKCLGVDPKESEARLHAIEIYRAQGNFQKAEALLNEGLSLQPRYEDYYRQKVYLLTDQNRVAEALEYLKSITTTYIVVKLNEERPAAISANHQPGVFSEAREIELNVPANTTVYYTLDGNTPDRDSEIYIPGSKIRIEAGTVNLRAVAINDAGMPGPEYDATFRIYNEKTEYAFKDPKVEQIVRTVLGKPSGTLYYKDLELITSFDVSVAAGAGELALLDDLLNMANLSTVNLDGEQHILSLDPLRRLSQLRSLSMDGCALTDEQFSTLSLIVWLQNLSIENNNLTNLSGAMAMVSLQELDASGNKIKSVPSLNRLASLKTLDLSNNALNSVAWLSGQQTVTTLNLSNNLISDISALSGCMALTNLNLSSNLFQSISSLSECRRLETLDVSNNEVGSLDPLRNLTGLMNLSLSETKVTTLEPLSAMTNLTTLNVSGTGVQDFGYLTASPLRNLYAARCKLSDLATMLALGSLETLDIAGNEFTEIGSVALLFNLRVLNVSNNFVTDFSPLLNCAELTSVNCMGSKIPDATYQVLAGKGVAVIQ